MSKIFLIDAHGYLHRAYHALPPLTTSKGEPVNAIYGFARMIFKLLTEYKPDYLAVCFDAPGPTFRKNIYPEYKATRKETEPELKSQFPLSRELVQAMELTSFEVEGFEADDLIATLAKKAEQDNLEVVIVSSDKDVLQIVNEKIKVLNEPKDILFDREKVLEKWGVNPEQLIDVFSLMGDSSDNVPGIKGIGEKTAVRLIQDYGSVDELLKNLNRLSGKIKELFDLYKGQLQKSRELLVLNTHAPIHVDWESCRVQTPKRDVLIPFLKKMEFHKLVSDLISKGMISAPKEETKNISSHYETILNKEQLAQLVQTLNSAEKFAIDVETTGLDVKKSELVGISISWENDFAAYIPLRHSYLGVPEQLHVKEVVESLKPLLENDSIKKVGQNLKFDFSFLTQAGIRMKNLYFDTMVASYCLDPSRNSHGLKDLALEYLGRNMVRIEELVAPSSSRSRSREMAMDKVEIERVSPYACADADCTLQLENRLSMLLKEKKCESLFYQVEMPLIEILADMEMMGVKVDIEYLEKIDRQFSKGIQELETESYRLAGQEFNLNSSKQLAFILFEKLKLPPARKTKTGYSTDEEVLNFLSSAHELPRILLKHRELSKLKSTYIDGLLPLIQDENSRVHTSFNQTATATGRLSSSDPNLQNIPIRTEYGRMIRRAFVPDQGCLFLSADYSQIDLRILAHLSQDSVLCKAFCEGADIHKATAAEVFHVPLEKVTDEQRKRAKAINFGIVYGQQAFGLSHQLEISMAEAQETINKYFQKYSGVKDWIEKIKQQARTDGYVKTLLGRLRYLPEMHSKNGAIRAFAERTAINTPVQGTAADIIKVAMISINKKLMAIDSQRAAKMLLQVHDDLLFEVPENELEKVAKIVREEMENAVQLAVPIQVDLKIGKNWADVEPYKDA